MKTNFSTEVALDLLQTHGIDVSGGKMDIVRHDELISQISAECTTSGVRVTGVDSSVEGNVVSLTFEGQARALKTKGVGTAILTCRAVLSYSAERVRNLSNPEWQARKNIFIKGVIEGLKTGNGCELPYEGGVSARILRQEEEELPPKVSEALVKMVKTGAIAFPKSLLSPSNLKSLLPPNIIEKFVKTTRFGATVKITPEDIIRSSGGMSSGQVGRSDLSLAAGGSLLRGSGEIADGFGIDPSKVVYDNTDGSRNLIKFTGKDGRQFTLTREALIGLVTAGMLDIRDLKGLPDNLAEALGGVTKPTEDGIRKLKLDDETGS